MCTMRVLQLVTAYILCDGVACVPIWRVDGFVRWGRAFAVGRSDPSRRWLNGPIERTTPRTYQRPKHHLKQLLSQNGLHSPSYNMLIHCAPVEFCNFMKEGRGPFAPLNTALDLVLWTSSYVRVHRVRRNACSADVATACAGSCAQVHQSSGCEGISQLMHVEVCTTASAAWVVRCHLVSRTRRASRWVGR